MLSKILLCFIGVCSLCLSTFANWEGAYVGGSLNYEYFYGKRTDTIAQASLKPQNVSDNQSFHNKKFGFDLFTGFLCNFSESCWYWGLEPYMGYKLNENNLANSVEDQEQIAYYKRKWDLGLDFRIGRLIYEDLFVYAKVGPECGYFKFTHSNQFFNENKSQWVPGAHCAIGIEKQHQYFRIGAEVSYSLYANKEFTAYDEDSTAMMLYAKPRVLSFLIRVSVPIPIY